VVTARLRDEALQRVPMPVAALDALELQRAAHGPRDLGAVVPNITIHTARPRNNAAPPASAAPASRNRCVVGDGPGRPEPG
jgi:hypothetical protein